MDNTFRCHMCFSLFDNFVFLFENVSGVMDFCKKYPGKTQLCSSFLKKCGKAVPPDFQNPGMKKIADGNQRQKSEDQYFSTASMYPRKKTKTFVRVCHGRKMWKMLESQKPQFSQPKFRRYSVVWVLQAANVQHTDFCFSPEGHSFRTAAKASLIPTTKVYYKTFLETVLCQAKVHLMFALDKGRQ